MEAASQLCFMEMVGNVLVRHLVETGAEKIRFLSDVSTVDCYLSMGMYTSSSVQARPPPVDVVLRCL